MYAIDIEQLWFLAAMVFLFAGTIKGLVGIGLPTAVIGILSQVTDPRNAVTLLLLPMLITNAWQVYRSGIFLKAIKAYWPFATVMIIGIYVFSTFAASVPADTLRLLVGLVIILFVVTTVGIRPLTIPPRHDRLAQIGIGAIAGVMGGLTSLWSPPMMMYLLSLRLPKEEFVGALGFLILAGAIPLAGGYWQTGMASPELTKWSLAMVLPTLLGFAVGEKARTFLNGEQFRWILLVIFILLGVNLLRVSVMG